MQHLRLDQTGNANIGTKQDQFHRKTRLNNNVPTTYLKFFAMHFFAYEK